MWVGLGRSQKSISTIDQYPSTQIQKNLPYLIKKSFVAREDPLVALGRSVQENRPDTELQGFRNKPK